MQKTQDYYTPKTMPTVVLEGGVVLYFCVPRTYFEQKTMLRNYVESPLGPALSGVWTCSAFLIHRRYQLQTCQLCQPPSLRSCLGHAGVNLACQPFANQQQYYVEILYREIPDRRMSVV